MILFYRTVKIVGALMVVIGCLGVVGSVIAMYIAYKKIKHALDKADGKV